MGALSASEPARISEQRTERQYLHFHAESSARARASGGSAAGTGERSRYAEAGRAHGGRQEQSEPMHCSMHPALEVPFGRHQKRKKFSPSLVRLTVFFLLMHALRAGRGAHCVRVRRPSLPGAWMRCLLYLFIYNALAKQCNNQKTVRLPRPPPAPLLPRTSTEPLPRPARHG